MSFKPVAAIPHKPAKAISKRSRRDEEDEYYEDDAEVTDYNLGKKDISISVSRVSSAHIKDLIGTGAGGGSREKGSYAGKKGQALKDLQNTIERKSVDLE